ncbi:cytochrome c oxidase subunit IVB [Virgibacillus soli]|uniref:Cytochrome c oxidase subunit IVB n=1 Tax=Paracerasibacillus soli TaxID=480284 RepID=A0ABU5CP08_9BACI|nr:cytochrome c oxidase subunit IVB [Virgibacillus soli]MDY0408075.1 cytochrome c oxidase subunit IVB [Virgibacillus soli]
MTENTSSSKLTEFQKQKNKEEMKRHMISFALMIVATLIAFTIVATGVMDRMFAVFFLLTLATIQVAFQFIYFMHMKDKGHGLPIVMIVGGSWAAFLTIFGLVAAVWW